VTESEKMPLKPWHKMVMPREGNLLPLRSDFVQTVITIATRVGSRAVAGDSEVTISWDPVPGATSYNLYRSRFPGVNKSNGFQILNVTSPKVNTGFTNGTTYYMVVTAVNAFGESVDSADKSSDVCARFHSLHRDVEAAHHRQARKLAIQSFASVAPIRIMNRKAITASHCQIKSELLKFTKRHSGEQFHRLQALLHRIFFGTTCRAFSALARDVPFASSKISELLHSRHILLTALKPQAHGLTKCREWPAWRPPTLRRADDSRKH
jgi:hypothetical protein